MKGEKKMKKETKYVLACIGSNDALQQKCYEFLSDAKRDMEKILRMYILNFDVQLPTVKTVGLTTLEGYLS